MENKKYLIRVKNHIDRKWLNWFGAERIEYTDDEITEITIEIGDQTALHGMLDKIQDLNLELLSVNEVTQDSGT